MLNIESNEAFLQTGVNGRGWSMSILGFSYLVQHIFK